VAYRSQAGPTEQVLHEEGDTIQPRKSCVLKNNHDGSLDKDKTMDNVKKQNNCSVNSVLYSESSIGEKVGVLKLPRFHQEPRFHKNYVKSFSNLISCTAENLTLFLFDN
jgi:hypothetical protein